MTTLKELTTNVQALIKDNPAHCDDMLDMLTTVVVLLAENHSYRFRGASFEKTLRYDRLSVNIRFDKYAKT